MTRRRPVLVLLASLAVVACSSSSDDAAPATTVPATTVAESTTTSSTGPSTTSTVPASTTTQPLIVGLDLSSDGLGEQVFGTAIDDVLAYVAEILGDADEDSGWMNNEAEGLVCPGTEVRFIRWDDLTLMFADESPYANGSRHFAAYTYGPAAGEQIEPWGLQTIEGVGVGSTVDDLVALHPDAVVHPADELSGPSFYIEEGLRGFLTGAEPTDQLISFVGGYGCGE